MALSWRKFFPTREQREFERKCALERKRVLDEDLGHATPWTPKPAAEARPKARTDWGAIYSGGGYLTGFLVFVGSWIYCIAHYGYLWGVGLGWLPSLIVGAIAGFLWPVLVVALLALWFATS